MGVLPKNEYNTGGVHKPTNHEDKDGVEACGVEVASKTTAANNPNINNVNPGSH